MKPVARNIALYSSSGFKERYKILRKTDKAPVDFTDCIGRAEVRVHPKDVDPLITLTVVFPDPRNGIVEVSASPAEVVAALNGGEFILDNGWDLNVIFLGDATPIMYLRGKANLYMANTRVP